MDSNKDKQDPEDYLAQLKNDYDFAFKTAIIIAVVLIAIIVMGLTVKGVEQPQTCCNCQCQSIQKGQ